MRTLYFIYIGLPIISVVVLVVGIVLMLKCGSKYLEHADAPQYNSPPTINASDINNIPISLQPTKDVN